jgi:anti-anti-sigma factor
VARVVVPSIGQSEAPAIRDRIIAQLQATQRGRCFVLDLSQVSLISSLGLGTCVDLRNTAEKAGLRPAVFGMNRHLVDLFALMRIDRLFTVAKSTHELDQLLAS